MITQNILFDRFVKWHVKHCGFTRLDIYGVIVTGKVFIENGKFTSVFEYASSPNLGNAETMKDIFGEDAYSKYAYDLWHY